MSKDKHRSLERRRALLRRAESGGIIIAHEGGINPKNRDLVRLVREGALRLTRCDTKGFRVPPPKKFRNKILGSVMGNAVRTRAVLADNKRGGQ